MSHKEFVRWLLRDLAGVALMLGLVGAAVWFGPEWTGGVIAIVLVPVALVAVFAYIVLTSCERDTELRADHAHSPQQLPTAAAHTTGQDRPASPPGRSARPDVVTAWTESAWATHHTSLHPYRVTRPGR